MSRVARKPIPVPSSVKLSMTEDTITIGLLSYKIPSGVKPQLDDGFLNITFDKESRSHAGTFAALVRGAIAGSSKGHQKKLILVGVGYRAQLQGQKLVLNLGYSHPVEFEPPKNSKLKIEVPSQTEIVISGPDKREVGQAAAVIRAFRSPDAYKGKGVRYADEVIILKETKKK